MRRISLLIILLAMVVSTSAKDFTVVIDAGHGGKDPGAISANKKIREKDITLKVALMVGEAIAKNHPEVKVLYTRKTDVFVGLNDRARIANHAEADLFISIHTNAAKNRSAKGAETYILGIEEERTERNLDIAKRENGVIFLEDNHEKQYANFNPNSPESYIIFEYMQSEFVKESIHMAQYVQENLTSEANRHDRGVRQAGFLVLHATSMPSVLVELGYISNNEECLVHKNTCESNKKTDNKCVCGNTVYDNSKDHNGFFISLKYFLTKLLNAVERNGIEELQYLFDRHVVLILELFDKIIVVFINRILDQLYEILAVVVKLVTFFFGNKELDNRKLGNRTVDCSIG